MARVFLTDFGLAKDTVTGSRYTRTGTTLGTPAYMSPEQARGELAALTPASDVWALGCVLYECMAGRRAFDGDTPAAVIAAVLTGVPEPIAGVSVGVRDVVRHCLTRASGRRPPRAAALRDDLDRCLKGRAPVATRQRRRRRLRQVVVAAASLVALAALAALARRDGPPIAPAGDADRLAAEAADHERSDPARAAALLGHALAIEPARPEWRLRHGFVLWIAGEPARARESWAAIDPAARERPRADLCALITRVFHDPTQPSLLGLDEELRRLSRGAGPEARVAAAMVLCSDSHRRWEDALALLDPVEGWEAALWRAFARAQQPDHDRRACIVDYTQVLATGLPFPWVHYERARELHLLGQFADALADDDRALALAPHWVRVRQNRGITLRELGRLDEAAADLTAWLQVAPDDFVALGELALIASQRQEHRRAVELCDRALATKAPTDPGISHVLHIRGAARRRLGDVDGGMADIVRSFGLDPTCRVARYERGRAFAESGRLDEARQDFEALLAEDPEHTPARVDLAALLSTLGRDDEALVHIERALAANPRFVPALVARGVMHARHREFVPALARLTDALEIGGPDAKQLVLRAQVHADLGDKVRAFADYDAAVGLDPTLAGAWYGRATTSPGHRSATETIQDVARAVDLAPREFRFRATLVAYLDARGELDQALQVAEAGVALMPSAPLAWFSLGVTHRRRLEWPQAAVAFERGLALGPPADLVDRFRTLARECRATADGR